MPYKNVFFAARLNNALLKHVTAFDADFIASEIQNSKIVNSNLTNACFVEANLTGTDFSNSNITDMSLGDSCLIRTSIDYHLNCPSEGPFIGWKKCAIFDNNNKNDCIVKLLIPGGAKRLSGTGRKCRASEAIVLDIQDVNGKSLGNSATAVSMFNNNFIYTSGARVAPEFPFDENRWKSCSSGIHFFITREEALNY